MADALTARIDAILSDSQAWRIDQLIEDVRPHARRWGVDQLPEERIDALIWDMAGRLKGEAYAAAHAIASQEAAADARRALEALPPAELDRAARELPTGVLEGVMVANDWGSDSIQNNRPQVAQAGANKGEA